MFLKALELQGFKSFPDKTTIHFDRGMTAVVGPNGSGKSNISDAMRWVMGEQSVKTLRGGKMEDVIFDGTSQRKPMGLASVSLSFDNSDRSIGVDEDEVTITRRYDRSGESEYQINGKEVRLRDLNELLMDTGLGRDGYAMVGQGRIAEIVSAKSRERREIFEEAAGISKYRYRKAEAERKRDAAEENLLRLYDILSELESRIGPLKAQSEKAEAFLQLAQRRKTLEISLWLKSLEEYREELKKQERLVLIAQGDEERLQRRSDETEAAISKAYDRMNECLAKSGEFQQIKENLQNRVAELRSSCAVRENDLLHNGEDQKKTAEELSRFEQSAEELLRQIDSTVSEIRGLEQALQTAAAERSQAEEELLSISQETGAADQGHAGIQEQLNQLALQLSRGELSAMSLSRQLEEEEAARQADEKEEGSLRQKLDAAREELSEVQAFSREVAEKKSSLQNTVKGYELRLSSRREKEKELLSALQRLDLQIKEKKQRARLLSDLDNNMEGFHYSVKAIMKASSEGSLQGILGTVAGLISVKEEYALAVETALGNGLQNIVVSDEGAAKAAIRRLQRDKGGRATFLPLTSVRGTRLEQKGLENYAGYVGIASELVECEARYRSVLDFLLGRIVIADDLDTASAIAKKYGYRFRIVTLDGQQINAGGSYTGGSTGKSSGILSRKNEADKLLKEASALEESYASQRRKAEELRQDIASQEAFVSGARSELIVAGEDEVRSLGEEKRLLEAVHSYEGRLAAFSQKKEQFAARQNLRRQELSQLRQQGEVLSRQKEELEARLREAKAELLQVSARRENQVALISSLSLKEMELRKDIERQQSLLQTLNRDRENAGEEREALLARQKDLMERETELRLSLQRMEQEQKELRERIAEYEERILSMAEKRMEAEKEASSLRESQREISSQKEKVSTQKARLEEQKILKQKEYDGIITRLWEDYELTRTEAAAFAEELPDRTEANKELSAVRNRIKALGNVNLSAVEEYKEVSQRYDFLKGQVQDASGAKAELEKLIESLTSDMRRMFSESFEQINLNFSEIFIELFGGGKAELVLTDPSDVLESGIEIHVQPPGKIIRNLSSLSGGEQSFVAIAIYLAILKVRPSPFCVLDEIEAALDDVNVTKYARYLRRLCDKTQFILITHRRGTMEEADSLYGVTMQEQGVSKLLKLLSGQVSDQMVN